MTITDFHAKWAAQCAEQERINALAAKRPGSRTIATDVREVADAAHVQYPQYAGYWDTWVPVRITSRIRTKGGVRFEVGDITLATRADDGRFGWTAYSIRGAINVALAYGVKEI
jgi:hypothetical protein